MYYNNENEEYFYLKLCQKCLSILILEFIKNVTRLL